MDTTEFVRTTITHAGGPWRLRAIAVAVTLGGLLVLADGQFDGATLVAPDADRASVARSAHGCCS